MEHLKKYQLVILIVIVFFLVSNTVYDKVQNIQHTETKPTIFVKYDGASPEKMDFCGEPVPLYEAEVRERLDRELLINANLHATTILVLKRANRWFPQIETILKEEGIPDDFKYLMVIESSIANTVSGAGATGYWQIMKPTAKELNLEVTDEVDERYHVQKSTRAACQYIKKSYQKFGSWTNAAAAYNMGLSGMMRACMKQKARFYYDLLLNQETSRYVFRILALKEIMTSPQKYGFMVAPENLYKPHLVKKIEIDTTINNLIDFAHSQGISYKSLKTYNAWLVGEKLTIKDEKTQEKIGKNDEKVKTKKSYTIEIPIDAPFRKDELYLKQQNIPTEDSLKKE
jgi:membrane-bound lytic murein transglycosylase D